MNKINFSHPFNGKKWLSLLQPHNEFGMIFKPNLNLDGNYLGFSFKSNEYGLRDPSNIFGKGIIMGTSYAMGLCVNNEENWYCLSDHFNNFFNIGMPIGVKNHIAIINKLYKGSFQELIFIYHPNIWLINLNFEKASERHIDIFNHMSWKTDRASVLYLYIRWIFKQILKNQKGGSVLYYGIKYHYNSNYSYFNLDKYYAYAFSQISELNKIFAKFKNVYVFKIPIKEELANYIINDEKLKSLNKNYELMWNFFLQNIKHDRIHINRFGSNEFILSDYLPLDTHLNREGNIKFHQLIIKTLN